MTKLRNLLLVGTLFIGACVKTPPANGAAMPVVLPLATDGNAVACITLAASATPAEKSAAIELAAYLKQVTGAEFAIVTPPQAAGRPVIAVGPGAAKAVAPDMELAKAGDRGLGEDGIVLKSAPPNLILTGAEGATRGTLYAVYEFLEREVGVRWWTSTEEFVPQITTFGIRPLDVRYKPPFFCRELYTWGMVHDEKQWGYDDSDAAVLDWPKAKFAAHRRNNGHGTAMPASLGGCVMPIGWCHTFYAFLPPDIYFKDHPEWYSELNGKRTATAPKGSQLCLTNDAMLAELTKNVLAKIRKQPQLGMVSLSQNDGWGNCQCGKCTALDAAGGSPAASLLYAVNRVADAVAVEFPGFKVETLAYLYTRKPPVNVVPRPNVLVRFGVIERYAAQGIDSEANRPLMNELKGWAAIAPNLFLWDYYTNTYTPMAPNPNWQVFGTDLRTYRDHHVVSVFFEGEAINVSDFVDVKTYLLANLMWDPSRDEQAIIAEFMNGYYGQASPALRKIMAVFEEQARAEKFGLWYGTRNARWISLDAVNRATELFRLAEAAVEHDPARLARVKRARISLEHQWIRNYAFYREQAAQRGVSFLGAKDPSAAAADFAAYVRTEIAAIPPDDQFVRSMHLFMQSRWDQYLDQLTEIGVTAAKCGPLPAEFRNLPRGRIIDIDESLAEVSKTAGGEIVPDAKAANGLAMLVRPPKPKTGVSGAAVAANMIVGVAAEPVASTDRPVQAKTTDFASLGGFGRYHIYAVVRCEIQIPDGNFDAIVQDDGTQKCLGKASFSFGQPVPLTAQKTNVNQTRPNRISLNDGDYHVYDFGTYDLQHGAISVYVTPTTGNLYVDRFIFVRVP
ncbi:MAG: DUF4838 domain-containing protein [bacterium]